MSTCAAIGMKQKDGSIKAITLDWAGRPSKTGAILGGWYTDPQKVEALIALGKLFQLGVTVEQTKEQGEDEVTVAYGRDWGYTEVNAVIFSNVREFEDKMISNFYADYLYIFDNGKWFVKGIGISEWIELTVVVCTGE